MCVGGVAQVAGSEWRLERPGQQHRTDEPRFSTWQEAMRNKQDGSGAAAGAPGGGGGASSSGGGAAAGGGGAAASSRAGAAQDSSFYE